MATEIVTGTYNLGINKTSGTMTSWFTQTGQGTRMIIANEGASYQLLNLYVGTDEKVKLAKEGKAYDGLLTFSVFCKIKIRK